LHLLNSLHFQNWLDVWFEFLPRILFLWSTFGYLVFIIFVKWNTNYFAGPNHIPPDKTSLAPGLLNVLINMFLGGTPIVDPIYTGQAVFEKILLIVAFVSLPVMFIPKPLVLHCEHNAKKEGDPSWYSYLFRVIRSCCSEKQQQHIEHDEEQAAILPGGHGGHEEDVTELWVHQGLETIEFALGCISHTASYLRLWALSLAHSELSTVFYDKIVSDSFSISFSFVNNSEQTGGGFFAFLLCALLVFIGISVWLAVTLGIIMAMEVLSAFLHALRLHWVEFQSKFYKGDGHLFKPFVYKASNLQDDNDDEMI